MQPLLVIDKPTKATEQVFQEFSGSDVTLIETDFADQGRARNQAIEMALGAYTAFLDADDIWTSDWLSAAHAFLKGKSDNVIAHPNYNYFFETQKTIFVKMDQEDPEFCLDTLRFANYWDALCFCPTQIYREHPFCSRDVKQGWAYEDWYWSCETVASGKIHKIVPDTVLFKRRQSTSQHIKAVANKTLLRRHPLSFYGAAPYNT